MARKFYTPIDLQQLELLRPRLEQRTGDPTSGVEGQVFYNTTTDKVRLCTVTGSPGTWVDVLLGPVSSADIADGTIMNVDVNAAAAILRSKLDFGAGLVNADIAAGAAIAYAKLTLTGAILNGDLAGSIALSKLATDPLARANHTGTQLAATVSNFDTQVRTSRLDQMALPTALVNANNQKITNLLDPSNPQDAATKTYVDNTAQGLDAKASVKCATTANIADLALGAPGTIDGVVLANNDRVLVKDQTTPAQNGIYYFSAPNTLIRAVDADAWAELPSAYVWVEQGTTQADTGWVCTADQGGTLGTTAVTWSQFSGAGQVTAGAGLTKTGNTLDVGAGTGITVAADSVALTSPVTVAMGGTGSTTAAGARTNLAVPGRYDNAAAHGAGTTITIAAGTHGLGTGRSKMVQVIEEASGDVVECDVNVAATGDVVCTFAVSQAANAMRVLILGF